MVVNLEPFCPYNTGTVCWSMMWKEGWTSLPMAKTLCSYRTSRTNTVWTWAPWPISLTYADGTKYLLRIYSTSCLKTISTQDQAAHKDRIQDVNFRSSVLNQRSCTAGSLKAITSSPAAVVKFIWNGNFAYNWKSQPDLRTISYSRSLGTTNDFELMMIYKRFFSDLKDYSFGEMVVCPFLLHWTTRSKP